MTTITQDQGKELAQTILSAFRAGFPTNNHRVTMKDLFSSSVECDWSDGFKGTKTPDEIFDQFSKTWGLMVSDFMFHPNMIVVDTTNGKVVMMGPNVINIDGKMGKANLVTNPLCFVLTFDGNGKCASWTGYWDNEDATMVKALGAVSKAMKEKDEA